MSPIPRPADGSAEASRKLRIAICGTRGIPAAYGGFETFAEELGARLAERGHEVTVFGRAHVIPAGLERHRGVAIRRLPAPRHKYLETPVHTLLSFISLVKSPVDVALVCNGANSPFIWVPRLLRRIPVAVNVDGIERMRAKWNTLGKWWYRFGEVCSVYLASQVIADADVIAEYYRDEYGANSVVIPYGYCPLHEDVVRERIASLEGGAVWEREPKLRDVITSLGLKPGNYILYVSRLEPENNADKVIQAYNLLTQERKRMPLVIVGDAPYASEFKARIRELAGPDVIFTGFRFGLDYRALQLGAYLYIQATEVGGTHPALVEAMGFANCVIANSTPENQEVLGDSGAYYDKNDAVSLSKALAGLLDTPERVLEWRNRARQRAVERYDWEGVASAYEKLFRSLVRPKVS